MTPLPLFRSDNTAGACPEVLDAIARANHGAAAAYGKDDLSAALNDAMSDLFERRCWCFPVSTGTAANALALSAISGPDSVIACHAEAHILRNEDSAAEFFTGGVRLEALPGHAGRIAPEALESFARVMHMSMRGRWSTLSLTQLTEAGTVYGLEQIASLADIAHHSGAYVHMDGARFANAMVTLRAAPADLSWRSGVDILSFGATKNGAMNADAVIAFEAAVASEVEKRLKRTGHLYSKMRFMAAQLLAMLQDELWFKNAQNANDMAQYMCQIISASHGTEIIFPVEGNQLFVKFAPPQIRRLEERGVMLWQSGVDEMSHPVFRLVTSFSTEVKEIDAFALLLAD